MQTRTKVVRAGKVNGVRVQSGMHLGPQDLRAIGIIRAKKTELDERNARDTIYHMTGNGKEIENGCGIVVSVFSQTCEIIWRDKHGIYFQYLGNPTEVHEVPQGQLDLVPA